MALKLSISASFVGVPFPQAYARITNIHCNKDQVQYQVAVYASADARGSNSAQVADHAFYAAMPSGSLLPALYADLKKQPGFENATDC